MNMKKMMAGIAAVLAVCAFSQETARPRLDTPQKRAAYARQRKIEAIARQGGMLHAPSRGGCVRILNEQSRITPEYVAAVAEDISTATTVGIEVVGKLPDDGRTRAVLRVVERAGAPSILVSPEEMRGELNVARLLEDTPSGGLLEKRFRKELWRAFAMTLGAGNSIYQPCLMRTITSVAELDAISLLQPCPEVLDKIQRTADEQKLSRRRIVTYRTACREGWAPQPTNDVQRAIWDEIHAMPTEPIKIKPEAKKVSD